MADEIITRQQLVNASIDADSLEVFISGSDFEDVLTRLGKQYPTLAKLVRIMMETGGWKAYQTESALLATTPTINPSVGYAFDTKKLYLWNGSTWTNEGLSQYEQAKQYADQVSQQVIDDNIPELGSDDVAFIWAAQQFALMYLTTSGMLKVPDIETDYIYTEDGEEVAFAFSDTNGVLLFAIKSDGTLYYSKPYEERYLSQNSYRPYLEQDKLKTASIVPYFFEEVVAPYQTDGKLHQRMPAAIKVADNKLFVSFTQFNTANTDASNGRLVGRFVTYDLVAKTVTVDQNTIIMRDTGNTAIASRHPNLIKLKDGRYMCLFNETLAAGLAKSPLYAIYSTDCITWTSPVLKLADNSDTFTFTISSTIQRIHTGKYKDRLIVPIYNSLFEVRFMFSDDEGETWKVGQKWSGADFGVPDLQPNETSLVIDIDGSLIAHCRTEKNSTDNRWFYIVKSSDGGETIDFIGKNTNFPATNCAIGMVQAAQSFSDGIPKILASRPTSPTSFSRNHFRISASYDGLNSSQYIYKPFPDEMNVGYTHLLALDDQNFVLTMEKGTEINNGNNFVSIAFFNMSEVITNGEG